MSSIHSSPLTALWRKWKSLKLPWRRRWLAGTDLNGNQYYYFRPTISSPHRRILQSNPRIPYSDIEISPQWHQWLRHTRPSAPSLVEQQQDLLRQQQLKQLASRADERWASKPSVLDAPRRGNMELGVGDGEAQGTVGRRWEPEVETKAGEKKEKPMALDEKKEKENPWKTQKGGPGEGYQPESWTPGPARRR